MSNRGYSYWVNLEDARTPEHTHGYANGRPMPCAERPSREEEAEQPAHASLEKNWWKRYTEPRSGRVGEGLEHPDDRLDQEADQTKGGDEVSHAGSPLVGGGSPASGSSRCSETSPSFPGADISGPLRVAIPQPVPTSEAALEAPSRAHF